jgi:hypothetical protein
VGDELHNFGWNACSSALCPWAPPPHVERRYLVVPGLRLVAFYPAGIGGWMTKLDAGPDGSLHGRPRLLPHLHRRAPPPDPPGGRRRLQRLVLLALALTSRRWPPSWASWPSSSTRRSASSFLQRRWVNTDRVWAVSFVMAGGLTLVT